MHVYTDMCLYIWYSYAYMHISTQGQLTPTSFDCLRTCNAVIGIGLSFGGYMLSHQEPAKPAMSSANKQTYTRICTCVYIYVHI